MPVKSVEESLYTYAEEPITIDGTVGGIRLTLSNLYAVPPPRKVEIFVDSAPLRFRVDGGAPTSTVGEILNPRDRMNIWNRNDMENFRGIRTGGTSATLRVRWKR